MRVHHIQFLCKDLKLQVANFCNHFGFSVFGTWKDRFTQKQKIVLKRNATYFVLYEDRNAACDLVDNIALEVGLIGKVCEKMDRNMICNGPEILTQDGADGRTDPSFIEAAVIKSPVGNIKHTILCTDHFSGAFLPDFVPADHANSSLDMIIGKDCVNICVGEKVGTGCKDNSHLDHITLAVETGSSFDLMDWYYKYFGFTRCGVNSKEEADGFTVETVSENGSKLGLRLTAMQYHFCSEESMKMPQSREHDVKFIFAESLTKQGPNQVDTFLKENLGPGVQHIGLSSENIFKSVDIWKQNNVSFIIPPKHYYDEMNETIMKINQNGLRKSLQDHGVLLDIEDSHSENDGYKYLLQVFTQPIFEKKTFFFELIQRHGATGFGAGNIAALWRAVDAYLTEKHLEEQHLTD